LVTEIDGSKIKTGTITAQQLNVEDVAAETLNANRAAINKIIADEIDAKEITTDRLNTTPGTEGAGTVKIEGNDIEVFNKNKKIEVVRISGDILDDYPENVKYTIT